MKHYIITALMALSASLSALADNIEIPDVTVQTGETAEVAVNFSCTEAKYAGYQLSLHFPEGFAVAQNDRGRYVFSKATDRYEDSSEFTLSANLKDDGSFIFLCYSTNLFAINAGDGALLTFTLSVDKDVTPGDYEIPVSGIKFSDRSGAGTQLEDRTIHVRVTPSTPTGISDPATTHSPSSPPTTSKAAASPPPKKASTFGAAVNC